MAVNLRVDDPTRKKTAEALSDSEVRYRSLFDAVPNAVYVCDKSAVVQDYNRRAAELLGLEPVRGDSNQPSCGLPRLYRLDGTRVSQGDSPAEEVIRTGKQIQNRKVVVERPDGSRITVRVNCAPLRNPRGEITGAITSFDDITDYEQVQEELRESEERYRHLVETSPYGIGVHRDGQLLYCNSHTLQIFRARTTKDLMGRSMFEFVHPDDRSLVASRLRSIMERGKIVEPMLIRLIVLDGSEVTVEATGRPVQFQGQPAVQTVMRDVTEARQSQLALEHSRGLLQSFVENTPAAVAMLDNDLRYVAVSKRWQQDYQLGERDLSGSYHYDVFPEIRDMPEWQAIHRRCLAGAVERREEDRFVRADGHTDWLRWEIRPWRNEKGAVGGIIMFTEVITERKQAEEALRESEARLRTLLENLENVAIQAYEPDGTITFWNKGSEQLYGHSAAEALGSDLVDLLFEGQARNEERRVMADVIRTGELQAAEEVEVRRRDGSRADVFASRILHPRPGKPPEFVCFDVDVTDRKRAEEELALRQAEWLHAARLSTVGEMVAALSHEVSQPLSAIGNFAAAIACVLEPMPATERATLQEYTQAIIKQNHRCGAILQRLRDFSRRTPAQRANCDPNQLLREAVELVSNELRGNDVSIQFNLAPKLPQVSCDRVQIEQVIVNLLTNARDALCDQRIDRRTIAICSRVEDSAVVFEVADRGTGLSEEIARRLFEPFFTTKVTGMGVGLSICKTIVQDHGGLIEALTNEAGGATFRVRLPLSRERDHE